MQKRDIVLPFGAADSTKDSYSYQPQADEALALVKSAFPSFQGGIYEDEEGNDNMIFKPESARKLCVAGSVEKHWSDEFDKPHSLKCYVSTYVGELVKASLKTLPDNSGQGKTLAPTLRLRVVGPFNPEDPGLAKEFMVGCSVLGELYFG